MDMSRNRFKSSTERLIDKHGSLRVYESIGTEVYNPETQTVEVTSTLHEVKMFSTEPSYRETKSPNLVDKRVTVYLIATSCLPVKPKVGDKITDIYLGVDDKLEVYSFSHYEGFGDICMWRVLCIRV